MVENISTEAKHDISPPNRPIQFSAISVLSMPALFLLMMLPLCGCLANAQVQVSAARSLAAVADELRLAVDEYDADLAMADDAREADVIAAFVDRVGRDVGDASAMAQHEAAFREALLRIRDDRQVAWQRRTSAMDNVSLLEEVGQGLEKLAVQSMTLSDEARRYLGTLLADRRQREQ